MSSLASLATALLAAASPDALRPESTLPPRPQDAPPVELPHWSGTLALGAAWTDGNTETEGFTGTFNAIRRGEDDRWTFDLFSNYGRTTDEEDEDNDPATPDTEVTRTTANNSGGGAKYDYFFTEKTYAYANASAKVDHVADLDLRYILGAGIGRQWKETEKLKWGTEAGLSYVDEDFSEDNDPLTGLPVPSSDADFVALRLASVLAYQISASSSFEQTAEVLPSLEDSEDLIARVDNRLKMVITGKWIAQIQYVLDYDDSVPPGNDEADHRVVLSVGWSFGE